MANAHIDPAVRARLSDLARSSLHRGDARFSRFLDPAECILAAEVARAFGVSASFSGGYEGAERAIAAFSAEGEAADFPIVQLKASWDARYGDARHRDLMGAQMALGLKRDAFGDIVPGEGCAWMFVHRDAADYVTLNLREAGRVKLTVVEMIGEPEIAQPAGKAARVTVSSMRLDAVLAAAYHLSRDEAQKLIARELVKLNHVVESRTDARVAVHDLISARGLGRARVEEEAETRKGRIAVQLTLFG